MGKSLVTLALTSSLLFGCEKYDSAKEHHVNLSKYAPKINPELLKVFYYDAVKYEDSFQKRADEWNSEDHTTNLFLILDGGSLIGIGYYPRNKGTEIKQFWDWEENGPSIGIKYVYYDFVVNNLEPEDIVNLAYSTEEIGLY